MLLFIWGWMEELRMSKEPIVSDHLVCRALKASRLGTLVQVFCIFTALIYKELSSPTAQQSWGHQHTAHGEPNKTPSVWVFSNQIKHPMLLFSSIEWGLDHYISTYMTELCGEEEFDTPCHLNWQHMQVTHGLVQFSLNTTIHPSSVNPSSSQSEFWKRSELG